MKMTRKVKTAIEMQETFIYLSPLEPDGNVLITTTEPSMIKTIWELHKQYPNDVKIVSDDKYGTDCRVPPSWITIKPKRTLTDAQKKELVNRLKKGREASRKK